MNSVIKERIDKIEKGIVPEGYKKTKVGIIPEDWKVKKLEEISKINRENIKTEDKNPYYYYDLSSIDNGSITKPKQLIKHDALPSRAKRIFKKDDILFSTVRPNLKGFGYINFEPINSICSTGFAVIETKKSFDSEYIFNHLFTHKMENRINSLTVGSNYPALNLTEVRNLQIPIPQFKEQEKIADILSLWDKAIETIEKLIKEKEIQKKGLMQELLTGETRLAGFNEEWEEVRLGEVIKEKKEKSIKNNEYPILSVTKDGIVLQMEYFNKQVASKDNIGYKIVSEGNLVFSTMNLWMGSLDVLEIIEKGIVSPAYKVFDIVEEKFNINFIKDFMKSEKMIHLYEKSSEQGASVVRRNLDLKGLLDSKILLPSLSEQKVIAEIVSTADEEIELLKQLLDNKKEEKKGLMQLLLTGIVRV